MDDYYYENEFLDEAKLEAQTIIKAFIRNEDEAEKIKAKVERRDPLLVGQGRKMISEDPNTIEEDMEIAMRYF